MPGESFTIVWGWPKAVVLVLPVGMGTSVSDVTMGRFPYLGRILGSGRSYLPGRVAGLVLVLAIGKHALWPAQDHPRCQ